MRKILIVILIQLCCFNLYSQVISEADKAILEKIKTGNAPYKTFESNFQLTRYVALVGEKVVSGGVLYYNKPDQMAMRYYKPAGNYLIINGDDCYINTADRQNKVSAKSNARMRGMKLILSACMMGDFENMGAEKITCFQSDDYYIVSAEMNTKLNKSRISKVIINYDKKELSVTTLQLFESDGSNMLYELNSKKINQPIDGGVFIIPK